jgi:hypothetical protein
VVEWILVDCLIYQGLPGSQRRRATMQSDRGQPITSMMRLAHCTPLATGSRPPPCAESRHRHPGPDRSPIASRPGPDRTCGGSRSRQVRDRDWPGMRRPCRAGLGQWRSPAERPRARWAAGGEGAGPLSRSMRHHHYTARGSPGASTRALVAGAWRATARRKRSGVPSYLRKRRSRTGPAVKA